MRKSRSRGCQPPTNAFSMNCWIKVMVCSLSRWWVGCRYSRIWDAGKEGLCTLTERVAATCTIPSASLLCPARAQAASHRSTIARCTGGARLCPRHLRGLFLAWVVSRIDEVDAAWPGELHLDHRLLRRGPHIMGMLGGQREEPPWLQQVAFGLELFPHAAAERAAEDGDDLRIGMRVRRHAIVGRKF